MILGVFIFDLIKNPIIIALAIISIISLGAILDRLVLLLRMRFNYDVFLGRIRDFLSRKDINGAVEYVGSTDHPFARVCKSGLSRANLSRDALYNELDYSISEEKIKLESHVGTLSTIAYISPLLGLLGTVIGIIQAFLAMAAVGGGSPKGMMLGIAVALVTTAIGIIIAVPAAIMYGYFSKDVDSIVDKLFIGSRELLLILSQENIMDKTPTRVRRTRSYEEREDISSTAEALTPGISVAMLLILFFMMFAPLMYQSNIAVSTPSLARAHTMQKDEKKTEVKLNMYIARDSTVFINEEVFGRIDNPEDRKRQDEIMHQLLLRSPMRIVLISAHTTIYHKDVVDLIDRAKIAGAVKIALLKRKENKILY
ncbi:MotA/TolQ/ExbB proton channel family protein [candidate division WOR-3 bacterium]|nr:MotA/TolQ/ExbB proton channel family protein [candidate division WOR-3 bacterium]